MREFDAFAGYPEPKEPRLVSPTLRKIENRITASYRDREFYDGARVNGFGGMTNDGRWEPMARNLIRDYNLSTMDTVLQVGAHKGFLLYELHRLGIKTAGYEVSGYAAANSMVRQDVGPFTKLPYGDGMFDLVIAAESTVYTLNLPDAIKCLREIGRVGKGRS